MAKVVIIGAGLGGLQCGFILAKNGYDVVVLEKGRQAGGCLQTFKRAGSVFDTGFHYVGGLGEGEVLRWIFDYYGLMGLDWRQMNPECVDEIHIAERVFPLPSGYERFIDILSGYFPSQREGLRKYIAQLKAVGSGIRSGFGSGESMKLFGVSAYDFLCDCISDELLRKVLSGASLRLQYDADTLPLYVYAQIHNSFIQSGWRLQGGGDAIASHLAADIVRFGGCVVTDAEVVSLEEADGKIVAAVCADGSRYGADIFISDVHPAVTLDWLRDSKLVKNIYRRRISSLTNSYGVFTVNVKLKPGVLPYRDSNVYLHSSDADVWHSTGRSYMIYYPVPEDDGSFADRIDIITRMDWSDVEKYLGSRPMLRGEEYETFKQEFASRCLSDVIAHLPDLGNAIDRYFTSTSLTYSDYTSTLHGSAFGIMKDYNSPLTTVLSPRTPVENLLLTGQNLNLHGILGTSMTSLYTTAQLLGMDKIKEEFKI